MTSVPCHYETLAAEGAFSVHRCTECGGLTLNVGFVSVRLDERAFRAVHDTMSAARRALATRRTGHREGIRGTA
ncbi:hypothetical protein [Sandaracinus amylolyticus]|uniref:Transcription factor zinc-finger domain-containing protein n=1 Tax=Sandaracinus amylolyticus TaxID=927083 RepID=A0A0F6W0T9_9BACT|nr:hypothetical protein [Sandaracinus amylolyticus]AKF04606.1 hypothetical protein DB32_001755 [Sandaracinus amylolyticus]